MIVPSVVFKRIVELVELTGEAVVIFLHDLSGSESKNISNYIFHLE